MREFEHKRKVRKILSSPWLLLPLAVVFFFLVKAVGNIYLKDRASAAELRSSQERLARLEDRQSRLAAATEKLKTESGIESEIRDRFQMAKPGEREIVIVESAPEQNQTAAVSRSFLQKIWDFFTIR
ncbi:MAG: septum formation initiator family protein [Candidatus Taylorbacteria bacterium]|nr:septum formation initiator family protein [Candidatus Taylorbacteria bacterium]